MKKRFLKAGALTLAAILSISAFSGCSGKEKTDDGKVTITVSNLPDKDVDPKGYEKYQAKVAEFMELNPDINVVYDTYQFSTDTFYALAEGETLPTVFQVPFTEAEKLIKFEYVADITEQFRNAGFYDNVNDYVLDKISRDGKVYLIPKECYSMGLAMNLDIMEEAGLVEEDGTPIAPKTFEELAKTAATIKEKTGKDGVMFPTTNNAGGWYFTVLAWNFGADFMVNEDGKWKATLNSPEVVQALEYMKDLKWKYDVLPDSTLINNGDAMQMFGAGNVGMTITAPNFITQYINYGLTKDAIGLATMPAGPDKHITLMGGAYYGISYLASPEEIEAALKWLEFDGVTPNITEETKNALRTSYELAVENDRLVGIKDISIWKDDLEVEKYKNEIIDELTNVNPNHIKLYNDKAGVEFRGEEPVCCQDLYGVLDSCIQEVLTNKDADCQAVLDKANSDFQHNFLDYE